MVTVTTEGGSILKPYILRATYQWCLDFSFSPCIQAIVCPNTRVPRDYVESGMIILNISPIATHKLDLTNKDISFTGRFAGSAMEIWVPVKNVLAIFQKKLGKVLLLKTYLSQSTKVVNNLAYQKTKMLTERTTLL